MKPKVFFKSLWETCLLTLEDNLMDIAGATVVPWATSNILARLNPPPTSSLLARLFIEKTPDGALIGAGSVYGSLVGAKFTLKKGLPDEQTKRVLAVENDPHELNAFSGEIKEGYGKGVKTLIFREQCILKVGSESQITTVEYHEHRADRAGLHYDLAIAQLKPGTGQFEINVPRGIHKGRYAFVRTEQGIICTRMVDNSVLIPKPEYKLKHEEIFEKIDRENSERRDAYLSSRGNGLSRDYESVKWIIERKIDGSLGTGRVKDNRVVFRSHRPEASPYYEKLPAIDDLSNHSQFWLCRLLFPGPNLDGTVFMGEITHKDGASRVAGILNSTAVNARLAQERFGSVEYHVWDIVKYRGKDVSKLPYSQRRVLYEDLVRDIRLFNRSWYVIERSPYGLPIGDFYNRVIYDARGLPYSEGIVIKDADAPRETTAWLKLKPYDSVDLKIVSFQPGTIGSRLTNSLGGLICRDDSGREVVVGTGMSDAVRDYIWNHQDELKGAIVKARYFKQTDSSFFAPRLDPSTFSEDDSGQLIFTQFAPDPRNSSAAQEVGLNLYAEALAGGEGQESQIMLYRLKSAAGWRKS